jgi:hypothetical protein
MRFLFHCRPSSMPPYSLCKKGSQCKPRHNLNIRLSVISFYCRKYNYWIRRLVFLDKISTPKKGIYVWKPKQMKVYIQYFSYIIAVSFIGGGNRSILTCLKSDKLYQMMYWVYLAISRFKFTTLVSENLNKWKLRFMSAIRSLASQNIVPYNQRHKFDKQSGQRGLHCFPNQINSIKGVQSLSIFYLAHEDRSGRGVS